VQRDGVAVKALRFSKATLVKVVTFAAVSALFTVGLAIKIGNLQLFSHQYGLKAVFSDASGVFKGDAVKLAGVDVGRVSGAKIEDGKAIVSFTLDDSVKLPKDSVAAIRWRNVLGQRFLYIYPGNDHGSIYKSGDTIPVNRTENAGDLGEFLNHLGPILRAIDPQKANAFLDAMNTALSGNEAAVRILLDDGSVLATRLGGMNDKIRTLITSSDTVMGTFASQDHAIGQILDDLNILGVRLDNMTGDIDSLITNFAVVQKELERLLKDNKSNIDFDIRALGSVTANLVRNRQNLETTLCTLPAGLAGYFQTTSWGEWFNVRITEFTVKTSSGQVITDQKETTVAPRQGQAPPAYSQCAGAPSGSSQQSSGSSPLGAAGAAGGLGGLFGFAVSGGSGG
jgi:phospholipid/cholesterol/gamma-HCH transport system substrate-binding protein